MGFDLGKAKAAKDYVAAVVNEDKKSAEILTLTLRIEAGLVEQLKLMAADNERSINKQIVMFIRDGLKKST
jgi:hypothetical protein